MSQSLIAALLALSVVAGFVLCLYAELTWTLVAPPQHQEWQCQYVGEWRCELR